MIIREWSDSFELIEQHEHARLSGAVCAFWGDPAVKTSLWEAVILAVKEHDRAWIPLINNRCGMKRNKGLFLLLIIQ